MGGKGLFFLLASISLALLLFLLWLLLFLLEPRAAALGARLLTASRVALVMAGLAAVVVVASDFLSAGLGVRLIPGRTGQSLALHVLLPVSERLGRLAGVAPDRVKAGFIQFNNALLRARLGVSRRSAEASGASASDPGAVTAAGQTGACCGWAGARGGNGGRARPHVRRDAAAEAAGGSFGVLLLLPHGLQSSECARVLGEDVRNCAECGSCAMRDLKRLVLDYGVQNRIVGGGTLALMAVRELRPRAVVGVACERELVAAVRELGGVPVMAIPNSRPKGPCKNTRVDVPLVEEALRILLKRQGSACRLQ